MSYITRRLMFSLVSRLGQAGSTALRKAGFKKAAARLHSHTSFTYVAFIDGFECILRRDATILPRLFWLKASFIYDMKRNCWVKARWCEEELAFQVTRAIAVAYFKSVPVVTFDDLVNAGYA